VLDEESQPAIRGIDQALGAAPEHSVVDHQQVGAFSYGSLNSAS
jgi:hypothetical protein